MIKTAARSDPRRETCTESGPGRSAREPSKKKRLTEQVEKTSLKQSKRTSVFTVMEKLNPPSPMQFVGNLADNWKRFKQRFNIYLAASGAGGDDEKLKASIFLHVIGLDALDIYNSFQLDETNLTLTVLMTNFE